MRSYFCLITTCFLLGEDPPKYQPRFTALLGHARPFGEPVVSGGPFVLNTEAEMQQVYADYRCGAFGRWQG